MSAQPKVRMTAEEYLEFERKSPTKHEFIRGIIRDMAGASERHVTINVNVVSSLHGQLQKRPCRPYSNDLRVRFGIGTEYTYPDIVVVCGTPLFGDTQQDTLLNPTLIVEVLSPSTEAYDRGEKFELYRQVASLQEYVLVSQDKMRVERFIRQDESWVLTSFGAPDAVVSLPSIECTLALADIYEKVEFPPDDGLGEVIERQ